MSYSIIKACQQGNPLPNPTRPCTKARVALITDIALAVLCVTTGTLTFLGLYANISALNALTFLGNPGAISLIGGGITLLLLDLVVGCAKKRPSTSTLQDTPKVVTKEIKDLPAEKTHKRPKKTPKKRKRVRVPPCLKEVTEAYLRDHPLPSKEPLDLAPLSDEDLNFTPPNDRIGPTTFFRNKIRMLEEKLNIETLLGQATHPSHYAQIQTYCRKQWGRVNASPLFEKFKVTKIDIEAKVELPSDGSELITPVKEALATFVEAFFKREDLLPEHVRYLKSFLEERVKAVNAWAEKECLNLATLLPKFKTLEVKLLRPWKNMLETVHLIESGTKQKVCDKFQLIASGLPQKEAEIYTLYPGIKKALLNVLEEINSLKLQDKIILPQEGDLLKKLKQASRTMQVKLGIEEKNILEPEVDMETDDDAIIQIGEMEQFYRELVAGAKTTYENCLNTHNLGTELSAQQTAEYIYNQVSTSAKIDTFSNIYASLEEAIGSAAVLRVSHYYQQKL